jgi:pimeloyl-ACP methyl ester carboxylesterase
MSGVSVLPQTDRQQTYGPDGRSPWLDVDWREHQSWVTVQDRPVNVIDLGDGPAIVFVHGLSGSWPNWLEQLPVFARGHRVIAMDLPGFGHSPMPREPITISAYAIAYPQRVERLALVSAAGISTYRHRDVERVEPYLRRMAPMLAVYTGWTAARSDWVARRPGLRNLALGLVTRHPSRLPAPLAAEQLRGTGKPGFMQALRANIDYPVRERLPEIVCPTLIVWGDEDKVIPVGDASVFEELIPDSRKVVFEGTGHMAMLERPAAFNDLLASFLAE